MTAGHNWMLMLCAANSDTQTQVPSCNLTCISICFFLVFYSDAGFYSSIIIILVGVLFLFFLMTVSCTGSESQLLICSYDSNTGDCSHSEDAGVRCQAGELFSRLTKYFLIHDLSS